LLRSPPQPQYAVVRLEGMSLGVSGRPIRRFGNSAC
jgi:hypothetical protein